MAKARPPGTRVELERAGFAAELLETRKYPRPDRRRNRRGPGTVTACVAIAWATGLAKWECDWAPVGRSFFRTGRDAAASFSTFIAASSSEQQGKRPSPGPGRRPACSIWYCRRLVQEGLASAAKTRPCRAAQS